MGQKLSGPQAAVVRMGTTAQGGRISTQIVEEEIERLTVSWTSLERDGSEELFLRC